MSATLEESLLDFDINHLLQPSVNANDSRVEQQRRQVLMVKRKIMSVDLICKKYTATRAQWEQNSVELRTAREECKQVCIDYQDALQKCTQLGKNLDIETKRNAELDSKYTFSQNQYEGLQSHANQLQLLIKEQELVIEALNIEKNLKKNDSEDSNLSSLQKENKALLKDLHLLKYIALGKKKLRKRHKVLLQKYDSEDVNVSSEEDYSSDNSCDQSDFFDDSPLFSSPKASVGRNIKQNILKPNKKVGIKKGSVLFNEDNDSDCSNEVASEDTGRGSSLAFSEKCFNSPDYFNNDSPENITRQISKTNEKIIFMDSGTSPNKSTEVVHVATSPLIFDENVLFSNDNMHFRIEKDVNSPKYFTNEIHHSNDIVTIKEKNKLIDSGTSPIKDIEKVNVATSPLSFEKCVEPDENAALSSSAATDYQTSDINDHYPSDTTSKKTPFLPIDDNVTSVNGNHIIIDKLTSHCELEISGKSRKERQCLERNNSQILCDENSNDGEIDSILNIMRFTQKLVTPIPITPIKMHKNESINVKEFVQNISDLPREHGACRDSLALREETKGLSNSIDDLKKDMVYIKCLLENHFLNKEKSKVSICNESNINVNTEIFNGASQETVIIDPNSNNSNNGYEESEITNFNRQEPFTIIEVVDDNCTKKLVQNCDISNQAPLFNASKTQNVYQRNLQGSEIDNTKENDCRSGSVKDVVYVADDDSCQDVIFEEDFRSVDESDIIINNREKDFPLKSTKYKKRMNKKLSKLDKFKKKLLPKSKISKALTKKTRTKFLMPMVKITRLDPTAILNNKTAYENAAKVMAEIKLNEKYSPKTYIARKARKIVDCKKDNVYGDELDRHQLLSSTEDINPEPHTRRKSNNSRKLSSSSYVSTQSDTRKNSTSDSEEIRKIFERVSTDSPIVENKRILRSSCNRETIINLDYVQKADIDTSTKIQKRKLSNSSDVIQNISYIDKNVSNILNNSDKIVYNKPSKKQKRQLSNCVNEENLNANDENVFNIIKKQKLSTINNEKEIIIDNVKNVFNTRGKNQNREITNFDSKEECNKNTEVNDDDPLIRHPKHSILCKMLEKYGRPARKFFNTKVPDDIANSISKKLEEGIAYVNKMPASKKNTALKNIFDEVQKWSLEHFMLGLMTYLKDSDRKTELYNKDNCPPAPLMTKSEQVVLYIVKEMEIVTPNIVNGILDCIEFSLFHLNKTPEFDVIESLSHIYAILCRYFQSMSRLRLFIVDAMYCLKYKVVPIIKQCLEVWMHTLPLAHMGSAKSPLVTCLVYLLHFYKCDDKFNRVKEIRTILCQKYFYKFTDWNEPKVLEMFKNAINDVRDIPIEKDMMGMALILLGKRHGAKWCHKNIIKNMLMPVIESKETSMKMKQFCIKMLGPLLRPFPADMKVHLDITFNHLLDMLQTNPPDAMKEAIFTSLIYINHHNPSRVTREFLMWMPKEVSPEFESLMQDYVRRKPLPVWINLLSKMKL